MGTCSGMCNLSFQMSEHYWTPQSNISNETSTGKTFQRTISAQVQVDFGFRTSQYQRRLAECPPAARLSTALRLPSSPTKCKVCFCCAPSPFLCSNPLQDTLAYATALLNEKEQSGSSNGSESSPANENGERHLQQVGTTQACPQEEIASL